MKPPQKRRNRRPAKVKALLIPAAGPARRAWLGRFCDRLPEFAAQLGWTATEARQQADAIRSKLMKTTSATSTP